MKNIHNTTKTFDNSYCQLSAAFISTLLFTVHADTNMLKIEGQNVSFKVSPNLTKKTGEEKIGNSMLIIYNISSG